LLPNQDSEGAPADPLQPGLQPNPPDDSRIPREIQQIHCYQIRIPREPPLDPVSEGAHQEGSCFMLCLHYLPHPATLRALVLAIVLEIRIPREPPLDPVSEGAHQEGSCFMLCLHSLRHPATLRALVLAIVLECPAPVSEGAHQEDSCFVLACPASLQAPSCCPRLFQAPVQALLLVVKSTLAFGFGGALAQFGIRSLGSHSHPQGSASP
jgi:hypothetical protein